jgi:DNA-binding NtrC family response regulator
MQKVLIVDDDRENRETLKIGLNAYSVQLASDGFQALERVREACSQNEPFDLVLLDLSMPRMGGMEVLEHLKKEGHRCAVIVITAYGSVQTAVDAMTEYGAYAYIQKPIIDLHEVRRKTDQAIKFQELRESLNHLLEEYSQHFRYDAVIARSEKMQEVLELVKIAAVHDDGNVLITGAAGTGKGLIARVIHENSSRRREPFVRINVNASAETLIEDDLFGHERGAYANAERDRKGAFERAQGGTLLLDEIGDMPLHLQVKLNGVLEEGEIPKLGSEKVLKIGCRVIAATNVDLDQKLREGSFRRDLYDRLVRRGMRVHLPSLRERREDIELLIWHSVQRADEKSQWIKQVEPGFFDLLKNYDWPGNVRELENMVAQAVMFYHRMSSKEKPNVLTRQMGEESIRTQIGSDPAFEMDDMFEKIVDEILKAEERTLEDVIQNAHTHLDKLLIRRLFNELENKSSAVERVAKRYGLTGPALRDRLKKYGLDWKAEIGLSGT